MAEPRLASSRLGDERTVHVIQGEHAVSDAGDIVLSTVLGSCVSACLFDPEGHIGGMNHFLLPEQNGGQGDVRFAAAAMEQLLNSLLKRGASRARLRGKLFGGARMIAGLPDIGARNGVAAKAFLETEGIPCIAESLGGQQARRIRFWPHSGRAQMLLLDRDTRDPAIRTPKPAGGSVELF